MKSVPDPDLVIGLGCDRDVSIETLYEAIDIALNEAGANREQVRIVASIDAKMDEAALLQLAEQQAWPVRFYSANVLKEIEVPNPSSTVMKYMGTPAVAEAAALVAANTNMKDLIVEKVKYRGKDEKHATVSIARFRK